MPPLYSYGCETCGKEEDAFRSIDQRHNGPVCCHRKMRLEIRPSYVQPDLPGYQSPVTGKWVEGKKARRDDLARTGSRPWEGMAAEKAEAARHKKYNEQKSDKRLDEAVRHAYHQLPPSKRRILEQN
jgi:hypothetical protein